MKKSFYVFVFAVVAASMPVFCHADNHSTAPDRYFLMEDDVVSSLALLPPPPAAGSARFAYDMEQYQWGKSVRGTDRGRQAVADADLDEGWIDRVFSEAFGYRITEKDAREIYKLISGMKEDAGDLSTREAKNTITCVRVLSWCSANRRLLPAMRKDFARTAATLRATRL